MAKVSLRAYNREIESLIEQGNRLDEAVAHCRHILTTYPKHLETYRLLGKAYLEAKRYDQAVDIFQRVLVAAPEDFVSHVGMSIIADDQAKLDESIWHMERAFEVQPSNAAIQAELQRLFGRRDGVEPPKIRLTRGALAHMYVQGELYTQAISEIRAVLAHDQNRTDMQVLLARAHFRNGQKAEAAEACSSLLAVSPYCLDANRLMAEMLPRAQATDAAREYRRRVFELDPYAEFAQGSVFGTDSVADGAVMLPRLESTAQPSETDSTTSKGLASGLGIADRAKSVPSWLTSVPDAEPGLAPIDESDEGPPDFMREGGWREVGPGSSESAGADVGPRDHETAAVPGNLPEWVRALAPSEEPESESAASESSWQPSDWVKDTKAAQPDASVSDGGAGAANATPDWLRDMALPGEEPRPAPVAAAPDPGTVPSTLTQDPGGHRTAPQEQDDALAWLEGLAEKHGAKPEELFSSPEARPSAPPDWVDQARQQVAPSVQGSKPITQRLGGPEERTAKELEPAGQPSIDKPFDWLSGLSDQNAFEEIEKQGDAEQAPIIEESGAALRPGPARGTAEDVPDWLGGNLDATAGRRPPVARESSGEHESAVDLPNWLADLDSAKRTAPVASAPEVPSANLPDWLQSGGEMTSEAASAYAIGRFPAEQFESPRDETIATGAVMDTRFSEPLGGPQPVSERPGREPLPSKTRPVSTISKVGVVSIGGAQAELGRGNIAAALDLYGRLIRKGKSLEEIIRDLRDALYRYPVEVPIWQALGDAYMRANRLQEALDAYTKAEELLR